MCQPLILPIQTQKFKMPLLKDPFISWGYNNFLKKLGCFFIENHIFAYIDGQIYYSVPRKENTGMKLSVPEIK